MADAPFGFAGPKGMDAAVTRRLQEIFRATLDDPAVAAALEANSMQSKFMDAPAYSKLAVEKFNQARALLQRLGLNRTGA